MEIFKEWRCFMVGHLKNIDVGELSFVDKGANKKKYAFLKRDKDVPEGIVKIIKADLSVSIKSNGTAEGTTIRVNGKAIEGLKDFSFNLYKSEAEGVVGEFGVESAISGNVSCSYTLAGKEKNGFMVSNRYYLMKNDMEVKEEMKVEELVKQYFGEEVKLKKEESEAVEKALEIINEYKESFPEELKKSIGVVMKNALSVNKVVETSEESKDEPKDKADVKKKESVEKKEDEKVEVSEDKISEIVKAVVKELVPKKEEESTEEGKGETAITKKLDEIKEEITKKDESMGKITERLEAVEKIKGIKKQIDGQEEGDGNGEGTKKVLWKSFQGK